MHIDKPAKTRRPLLEAVKAHTLIEHIHGQRILKLLIEARRLMVGTGLDAVAAVARAARLVASDARARLLVGGTIRAFAAAWAGRRTCFACHGGGIGAECFQQTRKRIRCVARWPARRSKTKQVRK